MTASSSHGSRRRGEPWVGEGRAIAGLTLLAAALAAFRIGHQSLWLDEATSLGLVGQDWRGLARSLGAQEANMSAYYVLLKLWTTLGHGDGYVRALSALFATAAIPIQYFLARRLGGPAVARLAAFLLAANAHFVHYAQEARAYSLVVLLSALASLLLLRAVERRGWGDWLAYGVVAALLLHAHILGGLVLLAHALLVLSARPRAAIPGAAFAGAVAATLSLPLLAFFWRHRGAGIVSWVPPPSPWVVATALHDLAGFGAMAVLHLGGAAALVIGRRRLDPGAAIGAKTASLWLATPLLGLLLLSILVRPLFQAAYLIGVLPALAIVAAFGLRLLPPRPVRLVLGPAAALSLGLWYFGTHKEDWRSAVAEIAARGRRGDGLVVLPAYLRPPIDHYLRGCDPGLIPLAPASPLGRALEWERFEAEVIHGRLDPPAIAAAAGPRLWLVTPRGTHDGDPTLAGTLQALLDALAARGYRGAPTAHFQIDVRLLERAPPLDRR